MNQPANISEPSHPIVLVVDDNSAIRDMVSWALELDGYEPAEASEGFEALAWIDNAAREGRYPSVILLDLAMPGMDGSTFLASLQSRWKVNRPLPAIVVITALEGGLDASMAGVQQVIVKPFHVRNLLDMIRQLMIS